VLVCLRKHLDNQSTGVPIEAEIPLKMRFMSGVLGAINPSLALTIQKNPLVIEEFIQVTGRPVRSDTFSNLKNVKEIDKIFDALTKIYKM
jgi:hypothetical protein